MKTTPGVEYRYLVRPTLTLAADYRFGYIDYFGVNNDSYTHFLLGGFDYTFSPRLQRRLRAGVEFRGYFDTVGDETSPYAGGEPGYDINRFAPFAHRPLRHRGRRPVGGQQQVRHVPRGHRFRADLHGAPERVPGLLLHPFAVRDAGGQRPRPSPYDAQSFNEDTFDVAVGARYAFNRHVAGEIGYTHTSVLSQVDVREYDRNRVFVGVRLAY